MVLPLGSVFGHVAPITSDTEAAINSGVKKIISKKLWGAVKSQVATEKGRVVIESRAYFSFFV